MVEISVNSKHTGTVSDFTNSGNPVVELQSDSKRIVVKAREGKGIEEDDKLEFTIESVHDTYYLANLLTHAEAGSSIDPNSTPNIPIHHDGKSATSSRSEHEATKSLEDREFDPTTHGAPKPHSEERKRKFLRKDK